MINGASPAIARFGLGFLVHPAWPPNFDIFGAAACDLRHVVSSLIALAIATPLGIAIGLYLSMMAPRGVRAVVGPMVEMLAAIPSVILGFWGVVVLAPFVQRARRAGSCTASSASFRCSERRRRPVSAYSPPGSG